MNIYSATIRVLLLPVAAVALVSCAEHRAVVSVAQQRMVVLNDSNQPVKVFKVSTSKFGLGSTPNSNFTPLGTHVVAQKFGGGQPLGMKFKARRPTGEIVRPNTPGRDPIVTRILWLDGKESTNRNSRSRMIYIHGTPEEYKLGSPASYGCVRMASRDVAWLYSHMKRGSRVDILPGTLPVDPRSL